MGIAAFAGFSSYGVDYGEGDQTQERSKKNTTTHSQPSETAPASKQQSLRDQVARVIQANSEQVHPNTIVLESESTEDTVSANERFKSATAGYAAYATLRKDEVLFLNEHNEPVGTPQRFTDFVDTKPNFSGEYLYTPGSVDETGILTEVPTREWREYVKKQLQAEYPDQTITHDLNTIHFFREAYELGDPQLRQKISSGEIATRDQVYEYRIQQSFPGANGQNRVEYLQHNVIFRNAVEEVPGVPGAEKVAVPPLVQAELRRLLPGLFAQESGFRADAVNDTSNATGTGQFMPETWERYTGTDVVSMDYVDQVAVLGPMISDVYDRVLDKIGEDALAKLRSLFSTEEAFLESVIIPATISGFHTGPDRIAEAVRSYTDSVQIDDMPVGKDLFLAIATHGALSNEGLLSGFREESMEYVTQVYALADVLEEKFSQKERGTRLAQN